MYKSITGTINKYSSIITNKSFAGKYVIFDKMFWGNSVPIISMLPTAKGVIPLNLGYLTVLIMNNDTTVIITNSRPALKNPER